MGSAKSRWFAASVLLLLFVPMAAVAQGTPSSSRGANVDWPLYGNDQGGMHYQDLDQINPSNVSKLQPAWILHTGVAMNNAASFEAQPIIVDGMMFISTGHDQVLAVDPATGAIKWTYEPTDMPPLHDLAVCCGQDNRGVAVGGGRVFLARLDAVLVALDEQTGKVDWETQVAQWTQGFSETMAPTYIDNEVIVGSAGAEYAPRGFVAAYNAKTGQQIWRFYTTAGPGQTGSDSWAGTSWMSGGGTVWDHPEVDPQLGLVYFSTANASPDVNGAQRAGENLFTASIVALDYKTGQLAWYFQEVHHDLWDYDGPEPPLLFTWVGPKGQQVPAIGHANKAGYYFILDRANGKPLIPVTEEPVSTDPAWQNAWPTQPIPATDPLVPHTVTVVPPGVLNAPFYTPPREQPIAANPGSGGGPQWPPVAYSPRTHDVYLAGIGGYAPSAFIGSPNHPENLLGSGFGGNPLFAPQSYGLVDALDTTTGKMAWQTKLTKKSLSGAAVAGDLVFYGQDTGEFDAVDAKTGKLLWSWHNPDHEPDVGGANASPAVYAVNGREYVVMAFGGNSGLRKTYNTGLPGDAVIAFALPPGTAGRAGNNAPAPAAVGATTRPNIVHANLKDVPDGGRFPGTHEPPAALPAAGSTVYTVEFHSGLYFPSTVTVAPGRKVSIHLVDNDLYWPAGFAVNLPNGDVAMQGQIAAGHDAYISFTSPTKPGGYTFYFPAAGFQYQGQAGVLTVAAPGQPTSPSIPASQAPKANPGQTIGTFGGE